MYNFSFRIAKIELSYKNESNIFLVLKSSLALVHISVKKKTNRVGLRKQTIE